MEEINHFSHKRHLLKLLDYETIVGASVNGGEEKSGLIGCHACEKPISSGFAYACIQCHYFLHKACAQLPHTFNDPSLYHHPLTLTDLQLRDNRSWFCNMCQIQKKRSGFAYIFVEQHNTLIKFTACIDCCVFEIAHRAEADAIKEEATIKVHHEGHPKHALTLQLRPASFLCDACNAKDEGLFYECDTCDFWIHKTCASLAPTIQLPHHPNHKLVLVYSLPENFFNFLYYCEICNKYIRRNLWLYQCANCRYFVHIKCALNAVEQPSTPRDSTSPSIDDEDANNLLHFPMLEAFTDPLKLVHFETTAQHNDDETTNINHWSHEHPLILHVQPQPQANSMSGCSDLIEVCHGCVRPLSLPYYSCKDGCSFSLHKYCAELPLKLQHPLHPDHSLALINTNHSLSLINTDNSLDLIKTYLLLALINTWGHGNYNQCNGCGSFCNTFLYKCETCEFKLDVSCAFLPNTIKHKSHKHPLMQVIDPVPACTACNMWSNYISYACKACSFTLDMYCATRSPDSLGHRYCKGHEIPLTYPPVMDHPEDFFCDICEEEMNPKLPLYYCGKCKNSFHRHCINRLRLFENVFHEGITMNVRYHKHPLTYVRRKKTPKISLKAEADAIKEETKIKVQHEGHPHHTLSLQLRHVAFRCDACNSKDESLFYECDSSDFWIHKTCASLASTINLPHHPNHPLVLIYSLSEKFFNFLSKQEYDDDVKGLLHFPMSNAFTDPLKLLHFEKMTQVDDEKTNIKHWSHHHPLILTIEAQANNMSCSSDMIEVCQGCVRPLTLPYYSCKDGCSFTLHKYCAELPTKLQHSLHPNHSLHLINTREHVDRCTGCWGYVNTFSYKCKTCTFNLDVNCAFLPNTIKHKSHKHLLIQVIDPETPCNACDMGFSGISYACKACSFILGMKCAMRSPHTLGHSTIIRRSVYPPNRFPLNHKKLTTFSHHHFYKSTGTNFIVPIFQFGFYKAIFNRFQVS
ncbi:unnamed protein product [Lactuca virosa]|uniref:Phorbol-ester/DAG-type domain-containing protein n=1 Tax=Lactuca virosa TaxID=75947 RepID=A0AAU9PTC0_9ASTR|nr:unnamed protein product [Lactuca virosa]